MAIIKLQRAISDCGRIIGESHPRAKLTDKQVDMLRDLNDEGIGYRRLAKMFNLPRSTVACICQYTRRNAYSARRVVSVIRLQGEQDNGR